MSIPNVFRAFVEGLGSKKLAAVLSAVIAVFLAPIAFKYLGIDSAQLAEVLGGILVPILTYVAAQWHIDSKSGGQTTTSYLLTLKASQAVAAIAPDGSKVDLIAKAVVEALQKGASSEPPSDALAPAAVPALAVVPPAPPSP